MRSTIVATSAASALALCLLCASARAQQRTIRPGTALAAHAIRALTRARLFDKMNSQSWTASNPTLDRFYAAKVAEIDHVIDRLKHGLAISLEAVDDALDNRDARLLGGNPSPFWFHESL